MTIAEVRRLCRIWQRRLRLQDWSVRIELCRRYDMPRPGSWGMARIQAEKKSAVLFILDPQDADPGTHPPHNLEVTLVHELLHLHFAPFQAEEGTLLGIIQEQVIEALSNALVAGVVAR